MRSGESAEHSQAAPIAAIDRGQLHQPHPVGKGREQRLGHPAYVVSYANGVVGYLPPPWAVAEGGYEVDGAHLCYGRPQFDGGAYEVALEAAVRLASRL